MLDIEDRDWNAWVVPAELQDRVLDVVVAALRECGEDIEVQEALGYKWFSTTAGNEMRLRAINIARQAAGVPTFGSEEDLQAFASWLILHIDEVA